ncbi:DUF4418 family protein|uniref:DUF4418 domain-containing protein n=1 Tax=Dendrosporobacter quercicolus TaxID=146817 RepID=A0A1G9R0N5_9FIRM|nr:DUF4418 family protein [Dendrosporobacter quercicolus]NSL48425.1 DUF4418 family protein [Dendrosporobacter quercicolus DSM 1736]SDM16437.1 protein of unknown function [Dendrosporobacter quercicolus]
MKYHKIISWVAVITGFFLLILPRFIPICTGLTASGAPMRCHYTYQAEFLLTLIAIILAGALLVLKTAEARMMTGFTLALTAVVLALLPEPWVSGICANGGCGKTAFFTLAGTVFLAVSGAVIVWLNYRRYREED